MIRKFKVTAIRTDEYEIEIDDALYNDEWMKVFSSYMHKVEEVEELVKDLAWHQLRNGNDPRFIEGFGIVLRDNEMPFSWNDFDKDGKWLPDDQREKPAPGLNINVITEDDDYEIEIEEITAP